MVIQTITPFEHGFVSIEGRTWPALSRHGQVIEAGSIVRIVDSASSHVVVKKLETPL